MNPIQRPRLLFLCQTLPYPPDGGVQIRTYNILRLLAREFDVTALCFYRRASLPTPELLQHSLNELRKLGRIEVFPIPNEHSTARLIFDHFRSVMTLRSYTVYIYASARFRSCLKEVLQSDRFDIVHVDSLDLAGYLPEVGHLPVVCVHHNVESRLLRRRGKTTKGLAGTYIGLQGRLIEIEERRWCPKVTLNVAVSDLDRDVMVDLAPGSRFIVVPNGVDTEVFRPAEEGLGGMVFVGGYSWQPNRDAMEFFCREVLPEIRIRGVEASVTWVGRSPEQVKQEYADRYGVRLTGYVDDIRRLVLDARCYIAPLRAGGGTRLKILDAWAMGKAVVSTSVGCEGLDARDGENILVRDTPASFAEAVESIFTDAKLRQRLGIEARRTAETKYDWEVIGHPMLASYRQLCKPAGAAT